MFEGPCRQSMARAYFASNSSIQHGRLSLSCSKPAALTDDQGPPRVSQSELLLGLRDFLLFAAKIMPDVIRDFYIIAQPRDFQGNGVANLCDM